MTFLPYPDGDPPKAKDPVAGALAGPQNGRPTVEKVIKEVEKEIRADGYPLQEATILRTAYAVGQVVDLCFDFAYGIEEPIPGGEYTKADLEAQGKIATGPSSPGDYTPPQDGPPPPPPTGEGVPTNALSIVVAVRAKYPTPLYGSKQHACLREIAKSLGPSAGLLSKPTGNNYNGFSVDALIFKPKGEIYDVFISSDGPAKPQFSYTGVGDIERWRQP